MAEFDKKVDAYIAKSPPFAHEILEHLRELVHKACPEVQETIKWGFPHFEYKGLLCSMAAFKQHCSFGFWKGAILKDPNKVMSIVGKTSMGSFGRITSIADLPTQKIFIAYIKEAMKLNDEEVKLPARSKVKTTAALEIPESFLKALKKNKTAHAAFHGFSNSHKNEYVEWISEAKTEFTRTKRITTALEWLTQGKPRNWKYVKK